MEQITQDSNLGSINQFAAEHGADPKDPEIFTQYTERLNARRQEVAQMLGISIVELHTFVPVQVSETEAAA